MICGANSDKETIRGIVSRVCGRSPEGFPEMIPADHFATREAEAGRAISYKASKSMTRINGLKVFKNL